MSAPLAVAAVAEPACAGMAAARPALIAFIDETPPRSCILETRGTCIDPLGQRHGWRIVLEEAPGESPVKRLCRIVLDPYISTVVPVMNANDEAAMKHAARLFRDLINAWDLRIETA